MVTRKEGSNVFYPVSDPDIFKLLDVAKTIFQNRLVGVRGMLEEMNQNGGRRKKGAARWVFIRNKVKNYGCVD